MSIARYKFDQLTPEMAVDEEGEWVAYEDYIHERAAGPRMRMGLYLLHRTTHEPVWNATHGMVIAAPDPGSARAVAYASDEVGQEGKDIWLCDAVTVEFLGFTERDAGIVLVDQAVG